MAKVIGIKSKDHSVSQDGSYDYYAYGLAVLDTTTEKEIPAVFEQTQSLTSALIGITDYGAMFINTAMVPDAMFAGNVTITAKLLDGSEESATFTGTVNALIAADVGPLGE